MGCLWKLGKTLYEMPELLVARGALHAINLDGGGSETAVLEGGVVYNEPHCTDTPTICERDVGAIACLSPSSARAHLFTFVGRDE